MQVQVDLTQIILAVLGIVATIVTAYVIPLLKNKVGDAKWMQFINIVSVAVDAAEQLGLSGTVRNKLEYATEQIKIAMKQHGLTYDDQTIRAAIEAFVLQFNESDIEYTVDDLIKLKDAGIVNVYTDGKGGSK